MSKFTNLRSRWRPTALDRDFDDEIQCHLELRTTSYMKAGMTREVAEATARQQFGDVQMVKMRMHHARAARTKRTLALAASVTVLVGLWTYQATKPVELPTLPPGMSFVGFPPPKPVPATPPCDGWRRVIRRCKSQFGWQL
jgi:hypothetical protein